jgi:hypothetical protein
MLMAAAVAVGAAGCSSAPVRTGHLAQMQPELMSNSHWRPIASDVGFKLVKYLGEQVPPGSRFYIQGHTSYSDFDQIFRSGLAQELRQHGHVVVPTKAEATYQLAYGTRVSDHDIDHQPPFGSLTLLTAGIWGVSELAAVAPVGAAATGAAALADLALESSKTGGLSEVTVQVAVLGPQGAEITADSTYYMARNNARHYPELAMPPMYAAQGRALPGPPVAHFAVE